MLITSGRRSWREQQNRKTSSNDLTEKDNIKKKKIEETFELFGIEMIEALTPIVFMTTFVIAYHGPNASIFGKL